MYYNSDFKNLDFVVRPVQVLQWDEVCYYIQY